MAIKHISTEDNKPSVHKGKVEQDANNNNVQPESGEKVALSTLQQQVGNRAVQRLLVQRKENGAFDLDDETTARINRQRGGGQPLEGATQERMSESLGQDLSDVRVHTSRESDELNQQLSAKAFTIGQDIFFREGAYQPQTGSGQELIAHELTHVVQQSSGAVGGGSGGMSVNAPGDAFEQQADAVAKTVTTSGARSDVQRQEDEEEDLQMKEIQRQEMEDEEEIV